MKNLILVLGLFFIVMLGACGGGSSDNSNQDTPEEQTPIFRLTLQQTNRCGVVSPLTSSSVLVYSESPNTNPDATFDEYTSDQSGKLELEITNSDKISFTVKTLNSENDYVVYSFIDLDVDEYDFNILNGNDALTNDLCSCDSVNFSGEVVTGHYPGEFSTFGNYYWGKGIFGGYQSMSDWSTTIEFSDVNLCSENYKDYPLMIALDADSDTKQKLIGVKEIPTLDELSAPVLIDTVAQSATLPDLGFEYSLTHSLIVNDKAYFYDVGNSNNNIYFPYTELNFGEHYFWLRKAINGTFNGNSSGDSNTVSGAQFRTVVQQSGSASDVGSFSNTQNMTVDYNEVERSFVIQADNSQNFDMKYVSNYFYTPQGQLFWWRTYSPNSEVITLPKLDSELESIIATTPVGSQYAYIGDVEFESDYSSAMKKSIFSTKRYFSTGFSQNTLTVYEYRESMNINKSKNSKQKDNEFAREKNSFQ